MENPLFDRTDAGANGDNIVPFEKPTGDMSPEEVDALAAEYGVELPEEDLAA